MANDYTIKKKSRWWKLVPLTGRDKFSCTIGDTIYLTPERYDDYKSDNTRISTIALVEHEKTHVDQYRRDRHFKRDYVTSRKKRLQYEAEAYAVQARIRVTLGGRSREERVDRYAKLLSSYTYLLFMDYDSVYNAINKEYDRLERQAT